MNETLGQAVDDVVDQLERRAPGTGQLFRTELDRRMEGHNIGWRTAPASIRTGIAPSIIGRARQVLDLLPKRGSPETTRDGTKN